MSIPVALMLALLPVGNVAFAENSGFDPDSIVSSSFVLLDGDTGAVLASKNPDQKVRPSSTTKVMTALLLLEQKGDNLSEEVTVGAEVRPFNKSHSLLHLQENEVISLEEILYGMMVKSGNDCANVVAVTLTEKKEDYKEQLSAFGEMMTARAKELGMENTNFVNAHGAFDENHYTTARDMAILSREAMKYEKFREVVATKEYTFSKTNKREEITHRNTNRLLLDTKNEDYPDLVYEYCIGIKTGLAKDDDGNMSGSLVTAAEKDGKTLILAIMGDTSEVTMDDGQRRENMLRFSEAKKIFEYGFSAKSTDITTLVKGTRVSATLSGEQQESTLQPVLPNDKAEYMGTDEEFITKLGAAGTLDFTVSLDEGLAPPYDVGQKVGTVQYTLDGQPVYSCDVAVVDPAAAPVAPTGEGTQPGDPGSTGEGGRKVASLSANRSFMIAMLSIALMMLIIIFIRVMTAPRRRRRQRNVRRRYY